MRKSYLLDLPDRSAGTQLTQADAWVTGVITEQVDDIYVAMHIDGADDTTPDVVAPSDPGVSYVGASVRALRDSTGRISRISVPDSIPADAEIFTVGAVGDLLVALDEASADQGEQLSEQGEQLDVVSEWMEQTDPIVSDVVEKVDAAQKAADDATQAALDSLRVASQAAEDASSAVVLRVDSSRGLVFKNSLVSTVLSVTVFAKGRTITDIVDLQDAFGAGAYLEWQWRRLDDTDFGVISSGDSRIGAGGFTLTVSPEDVDTKTVFMCVLQT